MNGSLRHSPFAEMQSAPSITSQRKNSILTTHKVISVPFREIGWHCLSNIVSRAFSDDMSAIFPHNSRTMRIEDNLWGGRGGSNACHLFGFTVFFFFFSPWWSLGIVCRLWPQTDESHANQGPGSLPELMNSLQATSAATQYTTSHRWQTNWCKASRTWK